ncbi:MAG: DUF3105 domain-containing protein [Halobacteriaceae archaeon]
MPDCDYCGRSFDDEEAHLDHLAEVHADELGPIDRRRLEDRDGEERDWTRPALVAAGVLALGGIYLVLFSGLLSGGGGGIESQPLPNRGDDALLSGVQSYSDLSRGHVEPGTDVSYETMPPVGGPHYGTTADPRFYEEAPPVEELVHNLEHGHVVVYYDPAALTPEARESLRAFVRAHQNPWAAVVVVPTPVENPEAPYVLTAWGHKLSMDSYDAEVVRAFLAEYLGRGPERPVR